MQAFRVALREDVAFPASEFAVLCGIGSREILEDARPASGLKYRLESSEAESGDSDSTRRLRFAVFPSKRRRLPSLPPICAQGRCLTLSSALLTLCARLAKARNLHIGFSRCDHIGNDKNLLTGSTFTKNTAGRTSIVDVLSSQAFEGLVFWTSLRRRKANAFSIRDCEETQKRRRRLSAELWRARGSKRVAGNPSPS